MVEKFDTMRNGYNRYQVDDKIASMNEEIAMLYRKLDMYQLQSEEMEKQIRQIKEKYQLVVDSLAAKERAAQDLTRIAMKDANTIVNTAHNNADLIVQEALMTARRILLDVAKLGMEASELKGNMREQLDALSTTLEQFQIPPIPDPEFLNSTKTNEKQ